MKAAVRTEVNVEAVEHSPCHECLLGRLASAFYLLLGRPVVLESLRDGINYITEEVFSSFLFLLFYYFFFFSVPYSSFAFFLSFFFSFS
jgi:hypothetical protein